MIEDFRWVPNHSGSVRLWPISARRHRPSWAGSSQFPRSGDRRFRSLPLFPEQSVEQIAGW